MPEPWNETLNNDLDFSLPVLTIPGDLIAYIEKRIDEVSEGINELEEKLKNEDNFLIPMEYEATNNDANILEGRLAELYLLKELLSKKA